MREFGQYRIDSLIGFGGMGEVHRAYDTRRDREVALKLLPTALSRDPEYQKRFRRESYTVARLREPHVIPIHDYGEIDDQLYIDMRLVDGRSLGAMLSDDGAIDPARAVGLITQVADALDAAHADGLVHRDIKPSNILVTRNDFVYVVDFGIAHVTGHTHSALTMSGATLGTLDYMAPERFENRPIDPRTDVYSLACVLFECLTATRPFGGNDLPALMYGHLFSDPPKPSVVTPGVPATFDAVIAKGMAKKIEDRYPGAREFADAARAALTAAQAAVATAAVPVAAVDVTVPDGSFATAAPPGPAHDEATVRAANALGATAAGAGVHDATVVAQPGRPTPAPRQPGYGAAVALAPPPGHYGEHPWGGADQSPPPPPPAGGNRRTVIALGAVAAVAVLVAVVTVVVAVRGPSTPLIGPVAAPVAAGQAARPVGNSVGTPDVSGSVPVGATPGYMEIAPNGAYGYIANRAAGVLTVFDTVRNETIGSIPVPEGGPQFVAFSPDGSRAYVSIFNNSFTLNEVGVLDTATGTFIARVPTGVRPFALDVTPDGKRVYVPNHDSGSITVIDTANNSVLQEIKVAPNPHWVDVTPDGSRVWAANHESNVVSVIDTATNAVLATVPVGSAPHSIVALPGKDTVIVCNYEGNSLSVIDSKTNTVTATIPTGSHPQDITLSADGKHAYIATVDDNAIQVLNIAKMTITSSVPTGQSPTSVAVGPEGRQAYVTNLNDGTVSVLNIAGTA
ncbi:MAG: protein kinase domain-containing protein [Pseudonocardia sp.]